MRIHHLTMTAVGPYAGTEEIDFDRFGPSGRFLLTGPTGSGKSTIIDAIVFALYGEVSGEEESSKDRIRSALAEPATETVVELVFSTPSGVYRVRRTPAYMRPKLRGEGMTRQNPTVKLWRLAEVGGAALDYPVTRVEEATGEIERAVGLRRSQFTQTVVLPQGKFARFLRATSADRHELLRDVFGTGIYDSLQKRLATMAREATARMAQARTTLLTRVESAAPVLDAVEPEAARGAAALATLESAQPDPAALGELVAGSRAAVDRATADGEVRLRQAEEKDAQAREVLNQARSLHERRERRAMLLAERTVLASREEEDAERAARLAAAERAERVADAETAETRARTRAAAALDKVTDWETRLREADQEDLAEALGLLAQALAMHLGARTEPDDAVGPDALDAAADLARTEQGSLTALVEVEDGLPQRARALKEREAEVEKTTQGIEERSATVAQRPTARSGLEEALAAARAAAAEVPALEVARNDARARAEAAHRTEALSGQLDQTTARTAEAGEVAATAADEVTRARRRWISATAGSLAGELAEGEPCPVCGSLEHPSPALPGATGATRAQVEAAEKALGVAERALAQAARERDAIAADLERARTEAAGLNEAEADTSLATAQAALTTAMGAAEPRTRLTEELAGFDAATRELEASLAAEREQLATVRTRLTTDREALDQDASRCTRARGTSPSLRARAEELTARATAADAAGRAVLEATSEVGASARAAQDLARAVVEQGFTSRDEASSARLTSAALEALRADVQQALTDRARVRASLASPDLAGLEATEEPDIPACEAAVTQADVARTAALAAREQLRALATQVEALGGGVEAAARDWDQAITGSEALLRVSCLAAGNNELGTDLSTWVLLERFEEVLVFANERLAQMSSGRYELVRVDDEAASRARLKGLGLAVVDHLGLDQQRDPRTLSGGETFYVSLALALALADVVAAESGGVSLDTLFVDEGFGTLDPDTLEAVMAEIERLRAGGRTVGIVSHVEELRRQVPDHIEVRRAQVGSTLRLQAS